MGSVGHFSRLKEKIVLDICCRYYVSGGNISDFPGLNGINYCAFSAISILKFYYHEKIRCIRSEDVQFRSP